MSEGQEWLIIRTDLDEQVGKVRLSDFNLSLPAENIFDEPTRCYKVNKAWAKIITGALDLLTEIGVWKDAENEGYSGIQQILQMLEGDDCMDCDDVEACLATSAIIANLQAQITANLAAIQSNDTDIAANLAAIQANDTDIANLDSRVSQNEADIAFNLGEINTLTDLVNTNITNIGNNLAAIQSNDTELADHETRIAALEAAGGGGGGGGIKTTVYTVDLVTHTDFSNTTWLPLTGAFISHDFTLPNALIIFECVSVKLTGALDLFLRLAVNAVSGIVEMRSSTTGYFSLQVSNTFANVPSGLQLVTLEGKVGNGSGRINGNQWLSFTIIEYGDIPEELGIVTFDPGGYSLYTFDSSPTTASIESGGNPDNCLEMANLTDTDWLEIEIDLQTPQTITDLVLDIWHSAEASATKYEVYIDDVLELLWSNNTHDTAAWHSMSCDTDTGGGFPFVGTTIRFRVTAQSSGISLLKLDNLDVQVS